jgi:hypothetical protein
MKNPLYAFVFKFKNKKIISLCLKKYFINTYALC